LADIHSSRSNPKLFHQPGGHIDAPHASSLFGASDALLATRAADGDPAAFAAIVRRHAPVLRAFAIRLAGSHSDADDILQESLIAAWQQLPSLQQPDRLRPWLMTIVSRKATDRIRRSRPVSELDEARAQDEADGPESRAIASSRLEALSAVLDALPDGQRECWILKESAGMSYDEIADQLGVSVTVVRGRLARARATVVKEMEVWR
jgi:RNA polymerase sigma-70 factor (ECF subfamily)